METTLVLFLLLAQIPQTAIPNVPAKPASIEGIVRRVGTGEPVVKARVMLSGGPATSGAPIPQVSNGPKSTTTDKDGRFGFNDLVAGRYNLTVYANGYVRQSYGQRSQNTPGTPIILTAGQQISDIALEMMPTGTITGRIDDFDNVPMPGADVILQKPAYDGNGQRTMQVIQQTRSNDLGEYRLYWITPGRYYLRAEFSGSPSPINRTPNDFIGPLEGGYAPVYYPGTVDPASATEVEVLPGVQMSAIDLMLTRTKTFTVRGRVVVATADGAAGRPFASVRSRQPSSGGTAFAMNTTMQPDGTFEIRDVIPGAYVLQASTSGNPLTALRAEQSLDVNGNVEGVVITLRAGFDVPFHLTFDDPKAAASAIGGGGGILRPSLRTIDGDIGPLVGSLMDPPTIKQDGTFTIPRVPPGIYRLQLLPLPSPDFYLKAIQLGHTDALQDGIAVDHTPDSPVEVLIGTNAGKVEGTVVDRDGKPSTGTQVTLIPNDRAKMDRYKTSFTDSTGHFQIRGIFPADYRIFAWELIEPNAFRDPEFIRRFEEQGKSLPIVEGTNPSVELHLIAATP